MTGKDAPKGLEALNLMGFRLGEVAQGLKEAAEKIAQASGAEGVKTTVDVRVRGLGDVLGDAAPSAPGPVKPYSEAAPAAPQPREPLLDTFDEADAFVVTAELPGVAEPEVSVVVADGVLRIETHGARRYRAEAALPVGVRTDPIERRLANGILEVRLSKGNPNV